MDDISDKTLDSRTKAIKEMVGNRGDYAPPKSNNMLSHLNSDRAFNDYRYETTRKLVRQQEELLRNLSKVRLDMELEEDQIGKAIDYHSGSREDKYGHTLSKADKLKRQREKKKAKEEQGEEETYVLIPASRIASADDDDAGQRFNSDIQKLRHQVKEIASRHNEIDGTGPTKYYYDSYYFPGSAYVDQMYPELEMESERPSVQKRSAPKYVSSGGNIYKLVAEA